MPEILRRFESEAHGGEAQEEIACPLCGENDPETVLIGRDLVFRKPGTYPVVRCKRCGMEYVNPRPTPPSLGPHYPDDYFGYSLHEDAPRILQPFLRNAARDISRRRMRYLEQSIGRIQPGFELLDVGCGPNRLLQDIHTERDVLGTGLDFKPEIVHYVRERLQMPIVEASLEDAGFEAGRFDVVFMMEYLEHEPDPREVLQEARKVIKPGGHLALELPHIAAWPGRLFGRYWWNLDVPRHLMFFTPPTLEQMLEQTGFRLVSVKPFSLPLYVGMSLVQVLGLRHWRKHHVLYPVLGSMLALPLLPFTQLIPEFMFAVARAE